MPKCPASCRKQPIWTLDVRTHFMTAPSAVGLIPVTVTGIKDVTPSIRTLRLATGDGHYLPGFSSDRHITVGIDLVMAYSFAIPIP